MVDHRDAKPRKVNNVVKRGDSESVQHRKERRDGLPSHHDSREFVRRGDWVTNREAGETARQQQEGGEG